MTTLVFGLGYLGAALAVGLIRDGASVLGVDNGFSTDWEVLEGLGAAGPGRFRLLRGDVRSEGDVGEAFAAAGGAHGAAGGVEAVYLLAAQASAHPDAAPAAYTEETNLRGPRLVCEAALRHGRPPVVYGSSFHVYGAGLRGAIGEGAPYGSFRDLSHLSKVYAEKLGEMFALRDGLPFSPLRLGIVYGLGPVTRRDLRYVTVPHALCLRATAGQPLPITASGLAPLGFVHLEDAAAALRLAPSLLSREAPYVPANAVGEVASALQVARLVQRTAWERGRDAVLQLHTPDAPIEAPAGGTPPGDVGAESPPEVPFGVPSRLHGAGWRPRGRLAETVPLLYDHYAALLAAPTA